MIGIAALLTLSPIFPQNTPTTTPIVIEKATTTPFFSQFDDISDKIWSKRSCGIASLAMVISEHFPEAKTTPDRLLAEGRSIGGYSPSGWIHAKLVELANMNGLEGKAIDVSRESRAEALYSLKESLASGPALASVHYKLEPRNPIPHLIVVHAISTSTVTISDPANKRGDEEVSIDKFSRAWKKRYISFRAPLAREETQ